MPEHLHAPSVDLRVPPATNDPQVLLAGLPPVYAQGLQAVMRTAGVACASVSDRTELTPLLAGAQPYVVVVPEARATALLPTAPLGARHAVVALVDSVAPEICADALRAGMTGVITSADSPDDVLAVLRCAARGRTVLPREVVRGLCRPGVAPPPALTTTERVWMRRLAAGATVAGLARSCGFSEREMYRRLSSVYLRLGTRTRTEALLLAERHGLLEEPVPDDVVRLP